jgi:hypothetical protein
MNRPDPRSSLGQRFALIGLALLFFAPLGFAFFAYYALHWHPGGQVNHGELIDPPQPIPSLSLPPVTGTAAVSGNVSAAAAPHLFKGKWTLLYRGPGICTAACRTELYDTRQVRTALRENDRVQRVFVAEGDCCDMDFLRKEHPDLITVRATPEAAPLLALLERGRENAGAASPPRAAGASPSGVSGGIFLVDPLGNLMMWYPPGAPPRGILTDLKRLLGLSHVG